MLERIPHKEDTLTGQQAVASYAAMSAKDARRRYGPLLADLPRLGAPRRCLEVGAGPGVLAAIVARENPQLEVTAVDVSEQMAVEAHRHLEQQGVLDRVSYKVCDVNDGEALHRLGRFELVYSTFSLHHWEDPVASIRNIWQTVAEGGSLYLLDLKRVWWMYYLPFGGGFFESIRAAYLPAEIADMMRQAGIADPRVNTRFPLAFMQSVVARR